MKNRESRRRKIASIRPLKTLIIASGFLFLDCSAWAQQIYTPPPLPNKDIDDYGLEVKTSRFNINTPVMASIGSEDANLSLQFPANDRDSTFVNPYRGSVTLLPFANTIEVKYGTITETFYGATTQHNPNAVTDYPPQILSGSKLRRLYDGTNYQFIFFSRDGTRYETSPDTQETPTKYFQKITKPSGLELYIGLNSIRSNMGYQLKQYFDANAGTASYQAINNTVDYCSETIDQLCSTTKSRIGQSYNSYETSTLDRVFITPTGEKTIYRYQSMQVAASPSGCVSLYLPTAVDLPASGLNEIIIKYNYPATCTGQADDIYVSQVSSTRATVDYAYQKDIINTGGYTSRGYNLQTIATIGGVKQYTAYSVTPPMSTGSAKRVPSTMLAWKDANGIQTSFTSDNFGRITGYTLPSGTFTSQKPDDRNNLIETTLGGASLPGLTTKRTFQTACPIENQAFCNLPTSIMEPGGAVTDYEYNPRGQLFSVTQPAATSGGVRPKTTYTYAMRYAYIKSSSGSVIAAGPPISMLESSSSCVSTTSCSGTADEIVTRYDYGPATGLNNLQLRGVGVSAKGADGVIATRWTCYTYNYFGEKISESRPKKGLAGCP